MKKNINIAIVGLGNIGSRLYKEIILKKKDIGLKTNTNINIVAISAKNINKKRTFIVRKNIFFKNPLDITKNSKVDTVPDYYIHESEEWLVFPHELSGLTPDEIIEGKSDLAKIHDILLEK